MIAAINGAEYEFKYKVFDTNYRLEISEHNG